MNDLLAGTTPGPWVWRDARYLVPHDHAKRSLGFSVFEDENRAFATVIASPGVWGGASPEERAANARLIALAPTLATENTALRSLCAELVRALEPFAEEAAEYDRGDNGEPDFEDAPDRNSLNEFNSLDVGQLRAARTAIARSKELLK